MKKSRAQGVLDNLKMGALNFGSGAIDYQRFAREVGDAIEQDTAEAEKRTHGPYEAVKAWKRYVDYDEETACDENFTLPFNGRCYIVEVEDE